jgi:glycosyltransferase involved in cell wall biosynthesis
MSHDGFGGEKTSVRTLKTQGISGEDHASWAESTAASTVPVFLSSYLPTNCGLATFTNDLADAVDTAAGRPVSRVFAIRKHPHKVPYGERVDYAIDNNRKDAYRHAALFCNRHPCDLVSIQHEYGLYTGDWGESILDFARTCVKPIVTTLHTLPLNPVPKARRIIRALADHSRRIVVMADTAVGILEQTYGVDAATVDVIPHGVHDVARHDPALLRQALAIQGSPVLVTFGLMSPGKGIEYMLDALPAVVSRHPRAVYLVVGATHPLVKREQGERYREELVSRAKRLGVWENVQFVDRFLSLDELLRYIRAADVYVTPYIGKDQIVSGTLAYALSAGRAIVSTPYLYAQEMAAKSALVLADFHNGDSLAREVIRILETPWLRNHLESKAWEMGRTMVWNNVGQQYYRLFCEQVKSTQAVQVPAYRQMVPVPSVAS